MQINDKEMMFYLSHSGDTVQETYEQLTKNVYKNLPNISEPYLVKDIRIIHIEKTVNKYFPVTTYFVTAQIIIEIVS